MLEFLLGACFFLCIFAPFTFVIFLIDAIKKVVWAGSSMCFYECAKLALSILEC